MKLEKNEGSLDRVIRVVVGVLLAVVGYYWLSGWVAIMAYVLAVVSFVTAATGFCGLYALFGIKTCKVPPMPSAPSSDTPNQASQ